MGACADCGADATGNFCSACGADLRKSALGFLGQAAAPVRRSFPVVYLKLLRAPVRQTVALAEDPSYRGHVSFALAGIALYILLFVPIVMRVVIPAGGMQVSESMQTLMKVLSQVGIYVGMAITFALAYGLFRYFATAQRPFHAYFKLYCLALRLHGAALRRLRVRRARHARRHRHVDLRRPDDARRLDDAARR